MGPGPGTASAQCSSPRFLRWVGQHARGPAGARSPAGRQGGEGRPRAWPGAPGRPFSREPECEGSPPWPLRLQVQTSPSAVTSPGRLCFFLFSTHVCGLGNAFPKCVRGGGVFCGCAVVSVWADRPIIHGVLRGL